MFYKIDNDTSGKDSDLIVVSINQYLIIWKQNNTFD